MSKIIAFFMSIWIFICNLFGISINTGVEVINNVKYGDSDKQVVDINIGENTPTESAGLVLFIHGGGWYSGDKATCSQNCNHIAKNYNYVTATMNYRLIGDGAENFDDMLSDISNCISKIKEVCGEKGINIANCSIIGYSAGAHLAMLYSYTKGKNSAIPVSFVVNQSGPADLTDENYIISSDNYILPYVLGLGQIPVTKEIIDENRLTLAAGSPVTYCATAVPTIIAHGDADTIVPYSNAVTLDAALSLCGVRHEFITYKGSDHDLTGDSEANARFVSILESYCKEYFGY